MTAAMWKRAAVGVASQAFVLLVLGLIGPAFLAWAYRIVWGVELTYDAALLRTLLGVCITLPWQFARKADAE